MVSSLKQKCDGLSLQIVVPHGFNLTNLTTLLKWKIYFSRLESVSQAACVCMRLNKKEKSCDVLNNIK